MGEFPMHLSLVMPSNRVGLGAYARILAACSWAGDNVEVIIRDNSGSEEKASFLQTINADNCKIVSVPPCSMIENSAKVVDMASGDFMMWLADDDLTTEFAIRSAVEAIAAHGGDESVAGIDGLYLLERIQQSAFYSYPPLDSTNAGERSAAFLAAGVNLLDYAPIRRPIYISASIFTRKIPFNFVFRDFILSILSLLQGRYVRVERVIYIYNNENWDSAELCMKSDLKYYMADGFDDSLILLHWLICAMEGARAIFGAPLAQAPSPQERAQVASVWYGNMLGRARMSQNWRQALSSPRADEASRLADKWLSKKEVSLDGLLEDLCMFFSAFSAEKALTYYKFWTSEGAAAEALARDRKVADVG
jgi:hypothetical protein